MKAYQGSSLYKTDAHEVTLVRGVGVSWSLHAHSPVVCVMTLNLTDDIRSVVLQVQSLGQQHQHCLRTC